MAGKYHCIIDLDIPTSTSEPNLSLEQLMTQQKESNSIHCHVLRSLFYFEILFCLPLVPEYVPFLMCNTCVSLSDLPLIVFTCDPRSVHSKSGYIITLRKGLSHFTVS